MEEEIDETTALSLGIGATSKNSKSQRGTGSNPKPPGRFSLLFPDQVDDDLSDGHTRKKLRLTDEQVTVLEGVYEEHCTLDTVSSYKKHCLAFSGIKLKCFYHRKVEIKVEIMVEKQLVYEARAGEEAEDKTTPTRSLVSEQKSQVLVFTGHNSVFSMLFVVLFF
jgi:hypothetical protein